MIPASSEATPIQPPLLGARNMILLIGQQLTDGFVYE